MNCDKFSRVSRHRVSFACRDKNCKGMYYNWIVPTSRAVVRHIPLSGNLYSEIRDSTGYSEFQFRRDSIFCKSLRRWYRGRLRSVISVTSGIHPRDISIWRVLSPVSARGTHLFSDVSRTSDSFFCNVFRAKRGLDHLRWWLIDFQIILSKFIITWDQILF